MARLLQLALNLYPRLLLLISLLIEGCAAWPVVTTALGGGVTVYKSARENGPKVELVLFKFQIEHNVYQGPTK
jgi:hypothetical protein